MQSSFFLLSFCGYPSIPYIRIPTVLSPSFFIIPTCDFPPPHSISPASLWQSFLTFGQVGGTKKGFPPYPGGEFLSPLLSAPAQSNGGVQKFSSAGVGWGGGRRLLRRRKRRSSISRYTGTYAHTVSVALRVRFGVWQSNDRTVIVYSSILSKVKPIGKCRDEPMFFSSLARKYMSTRPFL